MGGGRRRKRQEVRVWRHWISFGLLASLPAAAVARADLPLYTGWMVTSTREEGVEREYTERGRKRSNCHRICMSAAMNRELPPRQGQELTNASAQPRAPHHNSISITQAAACVCVFA